jgi:MYXO-CTERM domain-containing protein
MCLTATEPVTTGPCQVPEPGKFLPGAGAAAPAVAANFGLLTPAPAGEAAGWQFVCDDGYSTAPPDRLWRAPAGGFLAASARGLLRSDDGCDWLPVEGDVAGRAVEDLVIEAAGRVWALGSDPGTLYLSGDGGRRFAAQATVAATLPAARLRGAPSDPTRLYATAGAAGMPPGLWVSRDGGRSFTAQAPAVTLPGPLAVLAVAPDDAEIVYFKVTEPEGDELWKSTDGGKTLARLLKLADFELLAGLAFGPAGPSGQTDAALYVAGRAPIVVDGVPPGRLYVSRDGGGTWQPPVHSPRGGPSYRCLEFSGGKLFACAGGEAAGDSFLVGVSEDEGRSWTPVVRLADVHGPRACVRDRCLQTELWLCEGYGQCAAPDGGAGPGDGGLDAGSGLPFDAAGERPAGPSDDGGCGCALGGVSRPPGLPALLALLALLAVLGLLRVGRRNKSPA